MCFPGGASGEEPTRQCRRHRTAGSIPGLGRSPREGHGNPLQYSCLENPMDREGWRATDHGVAKSRTWLKQLSMHGCMGVVRWFSAWVSRPFIVETDSENWTFVYIRMKWDPFLVSNTKFNSKLIKDLSARGKTCKIPRRKHYGKSLWD